MPDASELLRLLRYDQWANESTCKRLASISSPPESVKLAAHIIATEFHWLRRLRSEEAELAIWPEWSPRETLKQLAGLPGEWSACLDSLPAAGHAKTVQYATSRGVPYENRVDDIVMHIITHSHYHRGQIAVILRNAGHDPPPTDLILAVREGRIH